MDRWDWMEWMEQGGESGMMMMLGRVGSLTPVGGVEIAVPPGVQRRRSAGNATRRERMVTDASLGIG